MPQENYAGIIRSWNKQQNFNTGPVTEDKLAPEEYGRIQTLFGHTWREEQLSQNFDWGADSFSVYLPESLYVVSSIYLKIELPQNDAADYKKYPGIYALKTLRLMSNGTEVYTCDVNLFFHDYLESLSEEGLRCFATSYLGGQTESGDARTIFVPILLPNSSYMGRTGDNKNHGIFPCYTGTSRLELQLTMNPAAYLSKVSANAPTSIAGNCSLMYHVVEMAEVRQTTYADLRGIYSIINRRFTELTSGWTQGGANVVQHVNQYQPQGAVTEILIIAVPYNADAARHEANYIQPSSIKVTADSIVLKDLDTPEKVKIDLWVNGFCPPVDFPSPGRLCFAAHAARADHVYSGAFNMTDMSNVDFEFKFPSEVSYRVIASQIQRITIDAAGKLRGGLH